MILRERSGTHISEQWVQVVPWQRSCGAVATPATTAMGFCISRGRERGTENLKPHSGLVAKSRFFTGHRVSSDSESQMHQRRLLDPTGGPVLPLSNKKRNILEASRVLLKDWDNFQV